MEKLLHGCQQGGYRLHSKIPGLILWKAFKEGFSMLEQMEKYVQSVLPDGIPQRKREPLHDELLCHLLDRYEFYREIGFDDEESTQKAIHDMG